MHRHRRDRRPPVQGDRGALDRVRARGPIDGVAATTSLLHLDRPHYAADRSGDTTPLLFFGRQLALARRRQSVIAKFPVTRLVSFPARGDPTLPHEAVKRRIE